MTESIGPDRVADDPELVTLIDAEIDGWSAAMVDRLFERGVVPTRHRFAEVALRIMAIEGLSTALAVQRGFRNALDQRPDLTPPPPST